jgi:hypothetical protein
VTGYLLNSNQQCVTSLNLIPFQWSTEVIHDQLFIYTDLSLTAEQRYNYIKSIATNDLLSIKEGASATSNINFMTWNIIEDSKYEWEKGLIRYALNYESSKPAFESIISVSPKLLPSSTASGARLLQLSSVDDKDKKYLIPTYSYISPSAKRSWYIGFCILYVLVILTMIFLICIRPFNKSLRNSLRLFWFGQNIMWFQLIFLFGFLAVEFKGALDEILFNISQASLKYFGADLEITFIGDLQQIKNGYYVGKYTGKGQTPYVLQKMFIPVLGYFVTYILSIFTKGNVREITTAIRAGIGFSYGVQFIFMCCVNFVAFFGAGAYNGFTIFGTLIALLLFIMVWVEVIMMKMTVNNSKPNFLCVEKNKGMSTYDILSETGDQRLRDFKNFPLNEVDGILLMAMIIGFFGRSFKTQTFLLIAASLLTLVGILMIKQQFKIWKLLLAIFTTFTFITALIFHFLGRDASLSSVDTWTAIFMTVFFLAVLMNLIIFILRLLDVLIADIKLKQREEVYVEKTPRKPQGEIVTYQREEDVAKISRSEKSVAGSQYQVNFNRDVQDKSVYEVRSDVVGRASPNISGFVPYREATEKKSLAPGRRMDDSQDNLNSSRPN